MEEPQGVAKPRVFLSYSRQDAAFAGELVISVESYGFEVMIDREDLFPGERWEPRLQSLIADADTTVCVVSAQWLASQQCARELEIAQQQGRRVIPVVIEPVNVGALPQALSRLQFIFFHGEGQSYARGVVNLINALRTDIGWVREQSRLLDKAAEWNSSSRSGALLLRGAALDRALEWIGGRKPEHTHVLPLVAEYIEASQAAQTSHEKKQLRGRIWLVSLAGLAIVGLLSSALLAVELNRRGLEGQVQELAGEVDQLDLELNVHQIDSAVQAVEPEVQGPTPSPETPPGPYAESVLESARARVSVAGLMEALTGNDRQARVDAGPHVAALVRGPEHDAALTALVAQLQGPRLDELSASGRFNVLYMLNLYDGWATAPQADALREALANIEARSRRADAPIAVGGQTMDCIRNLRAKLDGATGVSDRCGGR